MASVARFMVRVFQLTVICGSILILSSCQKEQPEEELIGIWSNTYSFFKYGEDGSFSTAYSVEELESAPTDWGTYTFDGDLVTMYPDEMGYCKGKTISFEVAFSAEGEVLYTAVEDSCPGAVNNMIVVPWTRVSP
jgi:hypothetical protein